MAGFTLALPLDQFASPAILTDIENVFFTANQSFATALGHGTDLPENTSYSDLLHPLDDEHEESFLAKIREGTIFSYEMIKRFREKEGGYKVFQSVSTCIFDSDGKKVLHILIPIEGPEAAELKNISAFDTGAKILESEMEMYRRALQIFDWKQALKDRFSSSAWVDQAIKQINITLMQGTGVGSLMSALSMVLAKAKKREDGNFEIRESLFDLLKEGVESTNRFINFLSSSQSLFEETQKVTKEATVGNLIECLREAMEAVEPSVRLKGHRLLVSDNLDILTNKIFLDTKSMGSVLREVLINGLKYSPDNSSILLLVLKIGEEVHLKFVNDQPYLGYIDEFNEDLVFEPFYRGVKFMDERFVQEEFGMGLGLPVIRKIVELHGGKVHLQAMKINLYEDRKEGICLTIRLPVIG